MEREVRYCTTEDGVRIAYRIEGAGPALLLCPILIESFSFDDTVPIVKDFVTKLGRGRTLIRYDVRGTGLSDRNPADVSLDAQVRDLEAVVASAGLDKITLVAPTIAGPRGIRFAVRNPDLMQSLILYGTGARGEVAMPRESLESLVLMCRSNWNMGSFIIADIAGREEFPGAHAQYAEWYRMSAEGEMTGRILEACFNADVTQDLSQITCPTLVLHRPKDPAMAFQAGQSIAAGIPNARFVPLPGTGHNMALGEPEAVLEAIDGFLDPIAPREEAGTSEDAISGKGLRTIVFTDVEASTSLTERLGDTRARELLREHERITRDALVAHGGSEVKTMGDGFMATFASVTDAVECAIALQRAFDERNRSLPAHPEAAEATAREPIRVRVGLNAGEPIAEDQDLFGTAVNLAARICSHAEAGQILAPIVVRELAAGKRFSFAEIGETDLRGFEAPVRLYKINWRESA
jgi:class 3 adenylate cyclase